jgi:hypothetical protein
MNGKIGLRIVSALVLIAAVAGIAFFAFQAGVAQGSPITIESPSGETVPAPYPYYGYGMPFHGPHFGFGYGFGCFGPLLAFFLIFVAFRFLFWGPRWGHHKGHWGRHWEGGAPPMFEEWHKRAHGQSPNGEPSDTSEKAS